MTIDMERIDMRQWPIVDSGGGSRSMIDMERIDMRQSPIVDPGWGEVL